MILESFPKIKEANWAGFDVHPEAQEENLVPNVKLIERDTIQNFPEGFDVCITNPPYLAKNSATRKGSQINFGNHQDLFEIALSKMLAKTSWVAAIIPESFITRGIFQKRLEFVISLNLEMFDDTEFPVCLAVFSPNDSIDFEIWRGDKFIGNKSDLDRKMSGTLEEIQPQIFKFNDPAGEVGLNAIDNTTSASIKFRPGPEIDQRKIKQTSRSLTRISSPFLKTSKDDLDQIISRANQILATYREQTQDVFLTSFKGLRDDQMYRRRLDWGTASRILGTAIADLHPDLKNEVLKPSKLF